MYLKNSQCGPTIFEISIRFFGLVIFLKYIIKDTWLHFDLFSIKNTRSKFSDKLRQPVPGHPELTSNKMAQIWNNLNLSNAKSITCTKASALKWYRKNPKI